MTLSSYRLVLYAMWISAFCEFSCAQNVLPQPNSPAGASSCRIPPPKYSRAPDGDKLGEVLKKRKRYRLVIGVGQFLIDPKTNDRTFVEPSARAVDERLAKLGFEALPSVAAGGTPYLTGKRATKEAIAAALQEMANRTQAQDFGIVYYVGHGNVSPSGEDLSLAVYEEPVDARHGFRASDLLGDLTTNSVYLSSIAEIPHFLVVIDACFSGTLAPPSQTIATTGGVQRLVDIKTLSIPPQVAILTSTSEGGSSRAHELRGTGMSAFTYYFARALNEDWQCADQLSPDGVLTLQEMKEYLKVQLDSAKLNGAIDEPMVPQILSKDENTYLLAYREDRYVVPGFRTLIADLLIQPKMNQIAEIALPGGETTTCSDSTNGCRIPISKKYSNDKLTIGVRDSEPLALGAAPAPSAMQTLNIADILKGAIEVNGVRISQSTFGCNSPAIAGVRGDVNININMTTPCDDGKREQPVSSPTGAGQMTFGPNSPPIAAVDGSVRYTVGTASAGTTQISSGTCSPVVSDTHGNVTITCRVESDSIARRLEKVPALLEQLIASSVDQSQLASKLDQIIGSVSPNPTDWFSIYVFKEVGSGVDRTRFPYADIQRNSSYVQLRSLLARIPHPVQVNQGVTIFRISDEVILDPSTTALATDRGNLGVLVISQELVTSLGSAHLAFSYAKSFIDKN